MDEDVSGGRDDGRKGGRKGGSGFQGGAVTSLLHTCGSWEENKLS